ncbi:MAG: protoporphyrinogen oxidase, partial [Acidobacteria bacterium]|nr:protoporphyrinogen oxidase [Acidobacteriota bacterium]
MKIAVLGGGISGLTAARRLRSFGEVTVFEGRERLGGNIRTDDFDGCRVEWGPNGFLDNSPPTLELVADLGLTDRLVQARSQAARRFVYRQGRLRELPAKPPMFLLSDALPLLGRLRVLLEPVAKGPPAEEESVFDFARRRIGRSAAEILVDAMVTGVFAGDPHRLSVAAAFPKLKALEANYGSLIRGAKGRGFG